MNLRGQLKQFFGAFMNLTEQGKVFWIVEVIIIMIMLLSFLSLGFRTSAPITTEIYTKEEMKQYHIQRVSQIPREKEAEEETKIEKDEDSLSTEDIRKRYTSYVIKKIESMKVYPRSEMEKGNEGSVILRIHLFKDGSVRKVTILRQARHIRLTEAAIESIRNALPFKAFPVGIPEDEMVITVEIMFTLN